MLNYVTIIIRYLFGIQDVQMLFCYCFVANVIVYYKYKQDENCISISIIIEQLMLCITLSLEFPRWNERRT